jgi:LAO/AO transport system kinase
MRRDNVEELITKFKQKDRRALARLISLVENDPGLATEIFKHFEKPNGAYIIGITGAPGVGKSTMINQIQ